MWMSGSLMMEALIKIESSSLVLNFMIKHVFRSHLVN
jgi:hypothetical protein